MSTLGELMDAYDAERIAQIEADEARLNTPEQIAKRAAKRAEEHARGVRLGWWDEDGEPIPQADDEDEEEDDDTGPEEYDDGRDFTAPYEP